MAKNSVSKEELIEQEFLTGIKDPELGVYCDLFSAKTGINGQDGGVVTSLLLKGLKEELFDVVIVIKRVDGYDAEVVATESPEEIIAARGTKYLKADVIPTLSELVNQGRRKIAIACTPCQAKAVRALEINLKREYPSLDFTVIGLFCLEAFRASELKKEVKKCCNANIDKAEKTEVRKGKFIVHIAGRELSCKISELSSAVERACHFCDDFTSKYADISVGSVGSQPGYSTVIVRSKKGKQLLNNLEAIKSDTQKEEITKLSKFKQERGQKNLVALKKR
jgi:coenzyme F420-reducing hydrogenase beta subunit